MERTNRRGQPGPKRRARDRGTAVRGRKRRRGRRQTSRRLVLGENPAHPLAALGADGRLLSGRRSVRRRKRAGHLGDVALQPRATQRDRGGQIADDHALQHDYRRTEPGERGGYGLDGDGAVAGFRTAAAGGGRGPGDCLGAHVGPVQHLVPGPGGICAEHERGAILSHAPVVRHHAAGDPAHVARRGAESGQQPDSGDGHGASVAERVGGTLLAGGPVHAGRGHRDLLCLPAVDPLGGGAIQFGGRVVPCQRTAGHRALAAAADCATGIRRPPWPPPPAAAC